MVVGYNHLASGIQATIFRRCITGGCGGEWDFILDPTAASTSRFRDVTQASNNTDFLAVGLTTQTTGNDQDILVARFTEAGTLVWARRIGDANDEDAFAIKPTDDGLGYVIAGYTEQGSQRDAVLLEIDQNGQSVRARRYGQCAEDDQFADVIAVGDSM